MGIVYDPVHISFGRRDCFGYLSAVRENERETLYICTLHAGANMPSFTQPPRRGRLFPVKLVRNGEDLPYTVEGNTDVLKLNFEGGSGAVSIQKDGVIRILVSGADLILEPKLDVHEVAKDRNDGSWELALFTPKCLFCPVRGTMDVRFSYDVHTSTPGETSFTFRPDDSGIADAAIHLYISNGLRLEQYPSFEAVSQEYQQAFQEFLARMPILPEAYEKGRILAAYLVWTHIMEIEGTEVIFMNKGIHRAAFSWQQAYQAMAQYRNPELAWKLIAAMFRFQDDYGMLPDCVDDVKKSFSGTKPPLQGLALIFLFQYTDFSFVPLREYRAVYDGISRLVFWWMSYRDTLHVGIPQYDAPDESGWDDSSMFRKGAPVATPDLSTYMILAMDALAVMAHRLNSFYEEREWKRRSSEMKDKMIEWFREGNDLVPRLGMEREKVYCGSAALFVPLLLGDRLPTEIRDHLTDVMMEEGGWLTPFGLAGERLDSEDYRERGGWLSGPVLGPAQLLACLGLLFSGKKQEAHRIVKRYADALLRSEFAMVMSAETGKDVSEFRWGSRYPNRMSWTGMVFLVLGSLLLDEKDHPS